MSTTRMPELPKAEVHRVTWNNDGGWSQYHDESDPLPTEWDDEPPDEVCGFVPVADVHAYGLAVWKAAMEAAAKEADDFAEMMESGAGYVKPGYRLRQLARTLRSLPLPESDMTQARGE